MFLSVVLYAQGWLWWHPPASVPVSSRHGLGLRQIARLSPEEWARVAKGDRDDEWHDAYGVALRAENRRLDRRTEPVRKAAFLYGMACIAVEDTLAGGGTYSIHSPHEMFDASERMIQALIRRRPGPSVARAKVAAVESTFRRCLAMRTPPERALGGKVDLTKLHGFADLALRYERELRRLACTYPGETRSNVDLFVLDWGEDYLALRGADRVAAPHRYRVQGSPEAPEERRAAWRETPGGSRRVLRTTLCAGRVESSLGTSARLRRVRRFGRRLWMAHHPEGVELLVRL